MEIWRFSVGIWRCRRPRRAWMLDPWNFLTAGRVRTLDPWDFLTAGRIGTMDSWDFLTAERARTMDPWDFLTVEKDWPLADKPLHVVQHRTLDIQEGKPLAAERPEIQISHGSRRVCCSRRVFRVPSGLL